ncbi:MAG: hypothetical protein AAGD06_24820, partial [Acidobacteriota bacterium]
MTPLPLLLLLVAAALGWGPAGRWLGARGGERILYGGLLGTLLLYGALWGADLLGIPWSPLGVLACLAATGVVCVALSLLGRRAQEPTTEPVARSASPWARLGDAVAAAAVLAFGVAGARLWNLHADFVYHWGAKGQRFFLAGGIDWEYLARPWNG